MVWRPHRRHPSHNWAFPFDGPLAALGEAAQRCGELGERAPSAKQPREYPLSRASSDFTSAGGAWPQRPRAMRSCWLHLNH